MVDFFKHAPTGHAEQKRFLDAVVNRRNVIATFPLAHAAVSVYAFAAMLGGGLVVVVCPHTRSIRRSLAYFESAGFRFPDIASLDGTQPPHEERAIRQAINRNQVRLLMTTPERFISLTFLEILVHTSVHFILIEEADRFLPITPGHAAYQRLLKEGLAHLKKPPPLALVAPPLSMTRVRELQQILRLSDCRIIRHDPLMHPVQIRVQGLLTEHQKFMRLVRAIRWNPPSAGTPPQTLIQTDSPSQAEKLGASLLDYGFESVGISHVQKTPEEQTLNRPRGQSHAIIVHSGGDIRYWSPPTGGQLVFWSPPASLDDFLIQAFRQSPFTQALSGAADPAIEEPPDDSSPLLNVLTLYTKEDFSLALQRIQSNPHLDKTELRGRTLALRQYRRWVISEECRLRSLTAFYESADDIATLPPCGRCDRCLARNARFPALRRWLRHWLF